uniref:Uncharacterized protein n=1 Tax=Arundo donax TaxID=35708 RepID=A0A0A8YDT7_ARUDO
MLFQQGLAPALNLNQAQNQSDLPLLQINQNNQQPLWVQPFLSDALTRILGAVYPNANPSAWWKQAYISLPSISLAVQLNMQYSMVGTLQNTLQQMYFPTGHWQSAHQGESSNSRQNGVQIEGIPDNPPVPNIVISKTYARRKKKIGQQVRVRNITKTYVRRKRKSSSMATDNQMIRLEINQIEELDNQETRAEINPDPSILPPDTVATHQEDYSDGDNENLRAADAVADEDVPEEDISVPSAQERPTTQIRKRRTGKTPLSTANLRRSERLEMLSAGCKHNATTTSPATAKKLRLNDGQSGSAIKGGSSGEMQHSS